VICALLLERKFKRAQSAFIQLEDSIMTSHHEKLLIAICAAGLLLATTSADATGMRVNSAKDDATGHVPAAIVLSGVPGIPASATDVDIVVTYRDERGTTHEARPTMFAAGCTVEANGVEVDVSCPLIEEAQ
jgi:hypothetical protein